MVTHTQNLCSAFNPSKCTHTVVQCCGARGAVGDSVPCSRVSPQSWYWGWREYWLFTPPTYNPCRTWDLNPRPSGYKSNSLSIRPRLPFRYKHVPFEKVPPQWQLLYLYFWECTLFTCGFLPYECIVLSCVTEIASNTWCLRVCRRRCNSDAPQTRGSGLPGDWRCIAL